MWHLANRLSAAGLLQGVEECVSAHDLLWDHGTAEVSVGRHTVSAIGPVVKALVLTFDDRLVLGALTGDGNLLQVIVDRLDVVAVEDVMVRNARVKRSGLALVRLGGSELLLFLDPTLGRDEPGSLMGLYGWLAEAAQGDPPEVP